MQQVVKFDKHTKFSYLIVTLLYIFQDLNGMIWSVSPRWLLQKWREKKQVMKRI